MKQTNCRWAWVPVTLFLLSITCFAQTAVDSQELTSGKPIERELGGGGVHLYSIKVEAGQFLKAVVDQRGVDVVVTLIGPGGGQLLEVDSPNGKQGPESVSYVAKSSGAHQIKVQSLEKAAAAGRYQINVEALRTGTAEEKFESEAKELAQLLAFAKSDEERATLLAQKKEQISIPLIRALSIHGRDFRNLRKLPEALALSRFALNLAEQRGDQTGIADSVYNIGYVLYLQGDYDRALEPLQQSLTRREELGEKARAGDSANLIAVVFHRRRDLAQALEFYQKSMNLYEIAGERLLVARMLNNSGQVLRDQGKHSQALEVFQKSSASFEALGDKLGLANSLLDLGQTHVLQGNSAAALESRRKALVLAEELRDNALIAMALTQFGLNHFSRGENAEALKYYQRSLEAAEALGDKTQIASTLNRIGIVQRLLGNYPAALEAAQRSWRMVEPTGNKALMSDTMMTLGLIYGSQGNNVQALESYQRSLTLGEEAGAKPLIANALEKIGSVYRSQGRIEQALDNFNKSLRLVEELRNKRQIIFVINAIANLHNSQGNYSQALDYFRRSLKLSEEIGNKVQIGDALTSIGYVFLNQGDYSKALHYYQEAGRLREETGQGVSSVLNNVGTVYAVQGNYTLALEHFQKSLQLLEKVGSKGGVRTSLHNIGEMYLMLGDYPRALEASGKSLKLSEELGDRLALPETMNILASIHLSLKDYPKALEMADRAATIASETGNRAFFWQARTTAGRAYRALQQPDSAMQAFGEAVTTIESLRTEVAGQSARASYFATAQKPYELYIDVLMQLHKQDPSKGKDAAALQLNERARARSLLEALSEAHADLRQGVDPVLVQRERSLQQRLNATAERQTRLLTTKHTEEQVAEVKKEIAVLAAEFEDAQLQIRQRSPRYAALTQPVPLGLSEIQQLLDPETLLLQYSLGNERSYLWAVSPNSIRSFELPKRADIETSVRRVVELLSNGSVWTTSKEISSDYATAAIRLSETLLPSDLMAELKAKRLVIVSDGALQYLPFGALPSSRTDESRVRGQKPKAHLGLTRPTSEPSSATLDSRLPLIADFEIVNLPSASTLAVLRRETANRARATNSVAVLADPVFEESDERIKPNAGTTGPAENPRPSRSNEVTTSKSLLERAFRIDSSAATDGGLRETLRIARLPFTRFEAEGILDVAPPNQSFKAIDFQANRATATSPELAKYRYIHFATHGILNSEHPELSGIVLSLVNEQGQPVDGFLRLHEIYNLNLPADLVVLSACQTGLGKEIRGEGLVGLTRGFMYAGAPRVVASLWKVDDAATAELMKRFYRGMLKENLRPAAALRQAKVEMWKQKRWQAPFYWAAFELQGEWK